ILRERIYIAGIVRKDGSPCSCSVLSICSNLTCVTCGYTIRNRKPAINITCNPSLSVRVFQDEVIYCSKECVLGIGDCIRLNSTVLKINQDDEGRLWA